MTKFYIGIGLLLSVGMCSHVTIPRQTPVDRTFFIDGNSEEMQDDQNALVQVVNIGIPDQEVLVVIAIEADAEDTDVAFNFAMRSSPLNQHPDAT